MLLGLFSAWQGAALHGGARRLVAERGLSGAWASVAAAPGPWSAGSVAVALGLSGPMACGTCQIRRCVSCLGRQILSR